MTCSKCCKCKCNTKVSLNIDKSDSKDMDVTEDWTGVVVLLGMFITVGWICWLVMTGG